jgi:hypothetical protein
MYWLRRPTFRVTDDFQPVAHARKQSVELFVADFDTTGERLADARLPYASEPKRSQWVVLVSKHHLPQHITAIRHTAL